MFRTRSVENIQFLPFLTTDIKYDWTLISVNTVGAALQSLYILAYVYFSPQKRRVLLQSAGLLGVLILGYCYFSLLIPDAALRLARLGLFCSVFTISMYLSPLVDLVRAAPLGPAWGAGLTLGTAQQHGLVPVERGAQRQSRSTRCLSFPLTVATFLTSASWTLYGFQLSDLYIMVSGSGGPRHA
nr:sugar transporter SWEET1 [Pelodiscus sinensis]|eukprot:XP_025044936.1 sugar transporter SWEET1 [Pelodiscus sinensis]